MRGRRRSKLGLSSGPSSFWLGPTRAGARGTSGVRDAAVAGQLEALIWAREHGCPWDRDTSKAAAQGGNIEVLRWAREHGCPWNEGTCASPLGPGN